MHIKGVSMDQIRENKNSIFQNDVVYGKLYEEEITNPKDILRIIRSLFFSNAHGVITSHQNEMIPVKAECMDVDANSNLKLYWVTEYPINIEKLHLRITGYNSVYAFHFSIFHVSKKIIETKIPSSIFVFRNRDQRRVRAPNNTIVRFPHPYWSSIVIDYAVFDMSFHGVSLIFDKQYDIVRGWRLFEVTIENENTQLFSGIVTVQHVSEHFPSIDDENKEVMTICGLRLIYCYENDDRWKDFVDKNLHGSTCTGKTRIGDYWRLYKNSGYFELSGKRPDDFESVREKFTYSTEYLSKKPDIGCHAIWQENDSMIATVTFVRYYSKTWQLMNLAKLKREKYNPNTSAFQNRQILKDIYFHAIERYLSDPKMKWFLTYAKKDSSWTRSIHHLFSPKYINIGESYMSEINLMEIDVTQKVMLNKEKGKDAQKFNIEKADKDDLNTFISFVERKYSRMYAKAMDLTEEVLIYGEEKIYRADNELYPTRKILLAKNKKEILAVAVMEASNVSPSLFSLCDNLKLYTVIEDIGIRTYPFLLYMAIKWFRSLGKSRFIYFMESKIGTVDNIHMNNLGEGVMHILSRRILPTFLEHVSIVSSSKL